jgi:two-component system, cell cycle response regulator
MGKKVLTVDDSKTLRMIVGKHLRPMGVSVLEAENGEVGIAVAKQETPDLILLDYNMPVLDGYHTLAELKSDPSTKGIPVIMLTTETVKETVVKLIKLGLKDYIAKPFTRDMLLAKVNPVLALYEGPNPPPEPTGSEAKAAAATAPAAAAAPTKPSILVVDDKESILKMVSEHLAENYRVICAESGTAALQIMSREHFDYMFLDLSMPDMSGFDVFESYKKIKKHAASSRKVVAMTLRTAVADINQAKALGIREILYKPFTKDDVLCAADSVSARVPEGESVLNGGRFLGVHGDVRVLTCPAERHPEFKLVASALGSEIIKEIDDMAEEGHSKLVIRMNASLLSDFVITRKFISLLSHLESLSVKVRLVAETDELRDRLKQYAETAQLPTDTSLEFAIAAFSA